MKKKYVVLIILIAWLPLFIGAWDKDKPAATTTLRISNPQILANNAALETALNLEHEFSTGGTTADQCHHRPGSARAYFQDAAPSTRADGSTAFTSTDLGSLWFDTNATPDNLYYVLTATTPTWTKISVSLIAEIVATANTWGAHQSLGAGFDLLGSTTSDINFGSGNFTVAGATGNTSVGGTFESVGIATLADASVTKTTAAPSADAQIANKKYVDKGSIKAFVSFDGDTGTINGTALNTTVARTDTGKYTLTWGTNFDSANYAIAGFCSDSAMSAGFVCNASSDTPLAAGSAQIETRNYGGNLKDYSLVVVFAMGNQ